MSKRQILAEKTWKIAVTRKEPQTSKGSWQIADKNKENDFYYSRTAPLLKRTNKY